MTSTQPYYDCDQKESMDLNEFKKDLIGYIDAIKQDIEPGMVDPLDSDYDAIPYISLTVGTDDKMTQWGYQTGDNSFTGGAYSFPHWAVTEITEEQGSGDIADEVIKQLTELLPENR